MKKLLLLIPIVLLLTGCYQQEMPPQYCHDEPIISCNELYLEANPQKLNNEFIDCFYRYLTLEEEGYCKCYVKKIIKKGWDNERSKKNDDVEILSEFDFDVKEFKEVCE